MPCLLIYIIFSLLLLLSIYYFFFFNDTATTEIYTLSLHDALPISRYQDARWFQGLLLPDHHQRRVHPHSVGLRPRSEEHTSELQSRLHLVCRLLLEKKKTKQSIERLTQEG